MLSWIHFAYQIINSYSSVFIIEFFSLCTKVIFLSIALSQGLRSQKTHPAWLFLLLAIIGSIFSNIGWIASISHKLCLTNIDYCFILFVIRIAWIFEIIFYQALTCFIESLSSFKPLLHWHQKTFIALSSLLALGFCYVAIFEFNSTDPRPQFETFLFAISYRYIFIIILPSIILAIRRIYRENLPKILCQQLKILIVGIICPIVISDFIQLYPFAFFQNYVASNLAVVSLSTLFITYGFYYSARRVMGLRFLNFQHHVKSFGSFNFVDGFKLVLSQLSYVNNPKDLRLITQNFFKDAFDIPLSRTHLYVRNLDAAKDVSLEPEINAVEAIVENFASRYDTISCNMAKFFRRIKIAIFDELVFSNFYEESDTRKDVIDFLERINADIFLPIYDRNTIIAYIVIERDARINNFYSAVERDEMVIFASYLGNIINLHQNGNIPVIVQREKEIREELYKKHQEIEKYKESFRSFLRDTKQRKIGILFYKGRHFTFGNKVAQEMLLVDPNKQEGHPLTILLKTLVRQVEIYRSAQTRFAKDAKGDKIVLSALPHLEQHNIIITIYYPEVADVVKEQIELLKNPSDWDYLLYLETTKSGQIINQLIPNAGERLLNFKIELLKMSLCRKALLLEMQEEDLIPTVEILHHLSMRETLHILHLKAPEQRNETAIKLFGINPIYGVQQEQSLLEKLNNVGTLFIQNIHLLDPETQQHLVEFLKYGFFHIFKSDHRVTSNVRIICSSSQNLQMLAQEGRFSRALCNELKQTTLIMPSLLTLSDQELDGLVEGFAEQVTKTQDFKNLLQFTDKEKSKIFSNRPVSLQEFKQKIQNILLLKSKKNNILHETQFDPAYHVSDPDLVEAARLGKKALKDPRLLTLLWEKFDKNQNRIAIFLGVNRSSVNRRCKKYNLEVDVNDSALT